jgi:hypothetical protein
MMELGLHWIEKNCNLLFLEVFEEFCMEKAERVEENLRP